MEFINKPMCDSCGGFEFEIVEIKKPEPEVRYVPASQYFKPPESYGITISNLSFGIPELNWKAICVKCGKEYLH